MKDKIHVLSRAVIVDQEHLLVCKTLDLPTPFYFLPGGHVEHGESAESAVLRELREEAGVQAKITRFLGCFEYSFEPGHNSICHNHEYNLFFRAESSALKLGIPIQKMEAHIKLLWHPLNELAKIDFRPTPLKEILPKWLSDGGNPFQSHMEM